MRYEGGMEIGVLIVTYAKNSNIYQDMLTTVNRGLRGHIGKP